MRRAGILAAALGTTLLVAGPAQAAPSHCPPGHAMKGWCWQGRDRDRDDDRDRGWREADRDEGDEEDDRDRDDDDDDEEDEWDRDRDARRLDRARERAYEDGYRDAMRDAWRIGQRLPRDRYRVVPDYHAYGLPAPLSGRGYVYADERLYLIELATGLILDVLSR